MVFKLQREVAHILSVWEWCKNVWYSNCEESRKSSRLFENDVKMYGIQTARCFSALVSSFENDVKMYGIQTKDVIIMCEIMFENDVKMYGIQTHLQEYQTQLSFENDVKMYGIQTG